MQLKLSEQALSALMFALTNSLKNEEDIVPTLMDWNWAVYDTADGTRVRTAEDLKLELVVLNPPVVEFLDEDFDDVDVEEF